MRKTQLPPRRNLGVQLEGLVLDIDGVVVDVSDSYRRAIVESVEHVYGATIDRAAVQQFKAAGGFNNDWELTSAAAMYVLARRHGDAAVGDVDAFTDAVATAGGGLDGARAVVCETLPCGASERVLAAWDHDRLRDTFQALYLGTELYRTLEPGAGPHRSRRPATFTTSP